MENDRRFFEIMDRVDEWAVTSSMYDCRDAAEDRVAYLLDDPIGNTSDDEIFNCACNAWMDAE
jgi:hypothetical protein